MQKIIAAVVFGLFLLGGCASGQDDAANAQKEKCRAECSAAFSQSPVAVGPAGARCGHFMSGNPISAECEAYFEKNTLTVSECESQ